jgi:hypothetical protein
MLERLRTQIGTAGLAVAIVALVAALGGGAYAASGGSGGGKATASAKAKPGKPGKPGKTGPQGPAGPAGPAGAKGDAGAAGSNGTNGTNGTSGTSPEGIAFTGSKTVGSVTCTEGGTEYKGATTSLVCNGKKGTPGTPGTPGAPGPEGSPWTAGGTLPPGKTEVGAFSISSETGKAGVFGAFAGTSISFPIPLAAGLDSGHVIVVTSSTPAECEDSGHAGAANTKNPEASPGYLCVYPASGDQEHFASLIVAEADGSVEGASPFGAQLLGEIEEKEPKVTYAYMLGSWAVTAPTA